MKIFAKMDIPNKENVTLKSVKRAPSDTEKNSATWSYQSTTGEGDNMVVEKNKIELKSTRVFHPDLITRLDELVPTLNLIWELEGKRGEATEVTGIAMSGEDETRGVVITGKKKAKGGVMAANSHLIPFNGSTYGIEEELKKICNEIEDEVYAYFYKGKHAVRTSIFSDGKKAA